MWFDDYTPEEEGHLKQLSAREVVSRLLNLLESKRPIFIGGIFLVFASLGDLGGPLALKYLIDSGIEKHDLTAIITTSLIYALLLCTGTLASYLQTIVIAKMGLGIVTRLKEKAFRHLLSLSLAYFDKHAPGSLIARVESDAERLQTLFGEILQPLLRSLFVSIATIAIMFATSYKVTLIVLTIILPMAIGTLFVLRYVRERLKVARHIFAKISSFLIEYVQALPIIQLFGYGKSASAKLNGLGKNIYSSEGRAWIMENSYWGFFMTMEIVVVMIIIYISSESLLGISISLGTVVLFIEYTRQLFLPIVMFSEFMAFVQRAFASADRVFDLIDTPSKTPDREGAIEVISKDWKEIRFEDVSFTYDGGVGALKNINFSIERGQKVALVGVSGGGKSTITHLLLRFYEPTKGKILLDKIDIKDIKHSAWRKDIGLVMQQINLFPGTLADNLRAFSDHIPEEALKKAIEIIQAEEIVSGFKNGLNEEIHEGGTNLSQGERQILSFARAIVNNPEILILDEATSSVDPITEWQIQKSLNCMLEGRTAIIVAHRLSTITHADKILVVQDGEIVEEGTHKELYDKDGVYRELIELQFGNAPEEVL
ncbi:MAG: ABC transporter ATP-binding protein [Pseudomonadota bacterium]